jgi:hypothetical protein
LERLLGRSVGRDLFFEFVPGTVRPLSDPLGVPIISGAVLAEFSRSIGGPVLEATWAGAPVMRGVLRAARHADAILAVSLPPSREGETADRARPARVAELAADVAFDRPLVLVARAPHLSAVDDGGIERMAEHVMAEVQHGFTAIGFRPQDIDLDRAERMTRAADGLVEMGIGIELELDGSSDAGLILAELEQEGLPLAAVRGCRASEDLAGGFVVVNPLTDTIPEDAPCRVVIDGFVLKALIRALSEAEAAPVLERAADDLEGALGWAATFIDELDAPLQERIEALTYVNVLAACRMLGAEGTATELLEAMAVELYG